MKPVIISALLLGACASTPWPAPYPAAGTDAYLLLKAPEGRDAIIDSTSSEFERAWDFCARDGKTPTLIIDDVGETGKQRRVVAFKCGLPFVPVVYPEPKLP